MGDKKEVAVKKNSRFQVWAPGRSVVALIGNRKSSSRTDLVGKTVFKDIEQVKCIRGRLNWKWETGT